MRFSSWLAAVSRHFASRVGRGFPASSPDPLTRSPFRSLRRRSHRRWIRQRIEPLEIRTLLSAAPTFSQPSYSFTIDENSSTIGTVSFSDDEGVYMVSSSDSNFWIDFDGTITSMMSFDYESLTTNPLTFTVTISDFEMQSASADVTITVNDIAEAPVFPSTPYSFTIAEDAAWDAVVGTVTATDPQNDAMYSILPGDDAWMFTIDSVTGELKLASSLNHESATSHTITVQAADMSGEAPATTTVTINITDVAEAPVFPSTPYVFSVAEDAAYDTVIGTVTATDPQNDATYSILSGNDAWMFSIDSVTGELKLASSLNYESAISHTITVQAADMSGEAPATTTVTINITDVAEAPVFLSTPYVFSIAEDAASDTVIGTVTANDPQNDATYSILSSDDAWMFTIDSVTGELKLATSLDYESATSHTITVQAADMSGEAPAITTVTINITDVNESPTAVSRTVNTLGYLPVTFNPASLSVDPENAQLTTIIVSMPDYGTLTDNFDGTYTYTLTSMLPETADSFTFRVDDGTYISSNIATVSITIDWASITIQDAGAGNLSKVSESLTGPTATFAQSSIQQVYVTLPAEYNPADFGIELSATSPGEVITDADDGTPLPSGTVIPLPVGGGPITVHIRSSDAGLVDINGSLRKIGGNIAQSFKRTKEFFKEKWNAWDKFREDINGKLKDGIAHFREDVAALISGPGANTIFSQARSLLQDLINDPNVTQTSKDVAQEVLNNMASHETAVKGYLKQAVFDFATFGPFFVYPEGSPEREVIEAIAGDNGAADQTKWKPKISLNTDNIISSKLSEAIEQIRTGQIADKLIDLLDKPTHLLKSASMSGDLIVNGKRVTILVGVKEFTPGGDLDNHKYEFSITAPDWNGKSISASGWYQPEDPLTGTPLFGFGAVITR